MTDSETKSGALKRTPLHALHVARGARMVPFAGYDMPVQYPDGILAEHLHTRSHAGLFDVSHMGQATLTGPDHATTTRALEALVPADIEGLAHGKQRYTQLLNAEGGILDDLMVTRPDDPEKDGTLLLVVNAACKDADFPHIAAHLPGNVKLERKDDRALLALQGPMAALALALHAEDVPGMPFMTMRETEIDGIPAIVTRSGYTGEDGYEISIRNADAVALADILLEEPEVKLIGLGARDSLRLEAGLCLYGHDIDTTTSPVEAALVWSMGKKRREAGGFPGHARIAKELKDGPSRLRVGVLPEGRAPAREGTEIRAEGRVIGKVTSGGFGPTLNGPLAMGYVEKKFGAPGTALLLSVRGKDLPAKVIKMPFIPHRYYRG